jgi:SIR2-like domain
MIRTRIEKLEMDQIVGQMRAGRCVPFLGAGVNLSSRPHRYRGLHLGGHLARNLARKLGEKNSTLARLALELEVRLDRLELVNFLTGALRHNPPDPKCVPSPLLQTLAKIRTLKLVVTTNYDNLFEKALNAEGRADDYEVVVQPPQGFDATADIRDWLGRLQQQKKLIVYKIHGSFAEPGQADQEPPPLIITEDDYIEFLAVLGRGKGEDGEKGKIGVPPRIITELVASSLLFLGYSLEDWDFRVLHKSLIGSLPRHHSRKSIAIQKQSPKYWQHYWIEKKVAIYDIDLYDFVDQLKEAFP